MLIRTLRWSLASAFLLALTAAAPAASDYQFTLNAPSPFEYTLAAGFSPEVFGGAAGASNPTLNLILGKRYGVTNNGGSSHPLEILAKGTSAGQDIVLLSHQTGVTGSLEADAGIAWADLGGGVVEFTVTNTLLTAMRNGNRQPGYRCGIHTSTMRGNFTSFGDGTPIDNPIAARIAKGDVVIELEEVLTGIPAPLGMADPNDGTGRVFIYDQSGVVHLLVDGVLQPTPFLDRSASLVPLGIVGGTDIGYDERGLLGFALSSRFDSDGLVYTYTSEPVEGAADFSTLGPSDTADHQSVIAEWKVDARDPNVVDTRTRRVLLRIDQPQFNHNGGDLAVGPGSSLFISLGDGGGADDQDGIAFFGAPTVGHGTGGNGQNPTTVLGALLRIDPLGSDSANGQYGIPADNPFFGDPNIPGEVWAYGFRNPYRFSFDSSTGELLVADVGQNDIEEVTVVAAGKNCGWRYKEGSFFFDPGAVDQDGFVTTKPVAPLPSGLVDPFAQYDHDDGSAIVGGFVYHGAAIPALESRYVCGDFGGFAAPTGRLFYVDATNTVVEFQIGNDDRPLGYWLKGFGQDASGELYVMGSTSLGPLGTGGAVLRIVLAPEPTLPSGTIVR